MTVTVIQAEGVSYTRVHEYEYYVCVCACLTSTRVHDYVGVTCAYYLRKYIQINVYNAQILHLDNHDTVNWET